MRGHALIPLALLLSVSAVHAEIIAPPAPDPGQTRTPETAEAGDTQPMDEQDACLLRAVRNAPVETPLSTLKEWCGDDRPSGRQRNEDALRERLLLEENSQFNPFVMTPHRRNYIMPMSYWSNRQWNDPTKNDSELNPYEVKFQLSIKMPLVTQVLDHYNVYFAYTQVSFFQVYNKEQSRPFRETNYMPELFVTRTVDWQFGPVDSELISFGYVHQSNGQDVPTSRGWDRLFGSYVARTGQYYWQLMGWYRFPENEKDDPMSPRGDDNPDIEKYMGNFELTVARPFGNHVVEVMLRNNLRRGENRGAGQIDYTFPISSRFKGIFQVFTGYGDSLINYDDYENRVSLGVLLTDTL
ncbi:outer membrane phospholipase A [Isoalcanivorax pacificus W11-5]|uniref:Phospholipase A1 n=1 Tax=Isoalcanivorax pacificus W11-5 TaxID=391936 RepID=A0A0B4XQL5_9GAMM|nr:phospholipase A [Isoalcanivorax pacificus]AJD49451.1 outer membrane phospholipase A [Isoalcanivorax pacificus W11-5]